jgi:hypothetical protein
MRRVYFRCFRTKEVLIDRTGALVDDLVEVRDSRGLRRAIPHDGPRLEDWRAWVLHVNDNRGDELFVVPFASCSAKRNGIARARHAYHHKKAIAAPG